MAEYEGLGFFSTSQVDTNARISCSNKLNSLLAETPQDCLPSQSLPILLDFPRTSGISRRTHRCADL